MNEVQLLDSYFEFFYAKEIVNNMYTVFKSNCVGCQRGKLSQLSHPCLTLSEYEQLKLYFEDILEKVNEYDVLRKWSTAASANQDISREFVSMYKLKIYCRDWRETDMKTLEWKSKIYKLCCALIRMKADM